MYFIICAALQCKINKKLTKENRMRATSRIVDGDGCCNVNRLAASSVAVRLHTSMTETASLLLEFEQEQEQVVVPDIHTYEKCCKQLVTFMATHMETSHDFAHQMDQVIRASYINAMEFTLDSTGAEDLWLRYSRDARAKSDAQTSTLTGTPSTLKPTINMFMAIDHDESIVTPHVVATASGIGLRPTCSPHVDLIESTPSTIGREEKEDNGQSKKDRLVSRQYLKKARHTVARNLYGAGSLECMDEDDMELDSTKDSESETEPKGLRDFCDDPPFKKRVDKSFVPNDQIVWPCRGANPLDRNPTFIKRLKLAVVLVDAENCCPPPRMKCMQECTSLRYQMCQSHRIQGSNARVCHDKMCCVWRDIDTHLVRCRNSDCEFKNSVGLRQTLHTILQNELKLKSTSDKLRIVKAMISETTGTQDDRPRMSPSQIESKIKKLEEECAKLEDAILLHKDRQRAFEFDLNALGISPEKRKLENIPSFQSHYARKRPRE